MKYSMIILPAIFAVVGCSSKDTPKPSSSEVVVPASLNFSSPAPGPGLTKAQSDEIKATFKNKSVMSLPPGDAIFPDNSLSPAEQAQKDAELKLEDPAAYEMAMDLRHNCKKTHPTLSFDATFPTDTVTADNASDILQTNDKIDYSGAAGLTGAACAVDLSASMNASGQIREVNSSEHRVGGSAGIGGKLSLIMKNSKYAQALNARGIVVDTNLSGLDIHRVISGPQDQAYVTFNLHGDYMSLTADIPYSMDVKTVISSSGPGVSTSETVATAELKYPSFTATLIAHSTTAADGTSKTDYYLNGRPMSKKDMDDMFGDNAPGSQSQISGVTQGIVN